MEIFSTQTTIEIVLDRNVCIIRLGVHVTDKKKTFFVGIPKMLDNSFFKCVIHVVQPWRLCRHP